MERRKRRILLAIAVLIFIVGTYWAIMDAQGYTYSFTEGRFIRTGTIVVRLNETANVLLNGERKGSTSFLSRSFGIEELLPGSYTVSTYRDGFSTWSKVASVSEGLITEFPHVLMLPTDEARVEVLRSRLESDMVQPALTPLPSPRPRQIPVVSPIPDSALAWRGDTLMLIQKDGTRTDIVKRPTGARLSARQDRVLWWSGRDLWVMWLTPNGVQPYYPQGYMERIFRASRPITNAVWFDENATHIAFNEGAGIRIIEIDTRGGVNIIRL
ncbi:MAG: hypothetical protein QY311_00330 [Candidatus Paceibacterota bacterium]|nr:MAG: hypothetical protein QY311_00330 [Candidatus Paceibacterota bacterium]